MKDIFRSFGFDDTEDIRDLSSTPAVPPKQNQETQKGIFEKMHMTKKNDNPFSGEASGISDQAYAQGRW